MKVFGVLSNPRSGTSLILKLMFQGFDMAEYSSGFGELYDQDIYGYRISAEDVLKNDIDKTCSLFIHIIRDPRDVILSLHPASGKPIVDFGTWIDNHKSISKIKAQGFNVVEVLFEDLISTPDKTQEYISSAAGLVAIQQFSTCFEDNLISDLKRTSELGFEMGGARRPDLKVIGKWRKDKGYVEKQKLSFPEINEYIKKYYNE